eukprot:gene12676-2319_t
MSGDHESEHEVDAAELDPQILTGHFQYPSVMPGVMAGYDLDHATLAARPAASISLSMDSSSERKQLAELPKQQDEETQILQGLVKNHQQRLLEQFNQ